MDGRVTNDPSDGELGGEPVLVVSLGREGTSVELTVNGDLDLHGSGQLRAGIEAALALGAVEAVEVDLRGVSFIDSSGLQAVLNSRDAVHAADIEFRVVGVSPTVARVADIAGLTDELQLHDP